MSQHDLVVANDTFPNVRSDINSGLQALGSNQSGGSAPATTYAYMWWADTTNGILKRRNAANSGWVIGDTLAEAYVAAKSSNYTAVVADHQRIFLCTSSFTLSLTAAATLGDGWAVYVRNGGTGVITIDPNASEQIDGATTVKLYPGESCVVACSGSAFYTVGRSTGWVLLQTATASASATIDMTQGWTSEFSRVAIEMTDIVPGTDATDLWLRVSEDSGSTFKSGASDYRFARRVVNDLAVNGDSGSTGASTFVLALSLGSSTGESFSGRFELASPAGAKYKVGRWNGSYYSSLPNALVVDGAGAYVGSVNAVNAARLLMSSGTIASGTIAVYGLCGA